MVILGLTGSIGMGKSTAANAFRSFGVPVHDADRAVHRLMEPGGAAVKAVLAAFPEAEINGVIDRQVLGNSVYTDDSKLKQLEKILHPLVRKQTRQFLSQAARARKELVVLDIPLLFETGGEARCDAIVVVSAPASVQKRRVMARTGMTEDKLATILSHQMSDKKKRTKADFIVETGLSRAHSLRQIAEIVKIAKAWPSSCWGPGPFFK